MRKRCTTRARKTLNKRAAREARKRKGGFGWTDLLVFAGMALGAMVGQVAAREYAKDVEKRSRFKLVE